MDGLISFRFFLKRHGSCHDRYKIVAPCKVLHFYNLPHEFENKVLGRSIKIGASDLRREDLHRSAFLT